MCFGDADALDSISLIADSETAAEASSRRPPVLRCDSTRDSSSRHMMSTAEEWKVSFFSGAGRVTVRSLECGLVRGMQLEYYTLRGSASIILLWSV
jgi:hypothetical protein